MYVRPFYGQLFDILVKKRNVLLIGTPGIGKVGIAQSRVDIAQSKVGIAQSTSEVGRHTQGLLDDDVELSIGLHGCSLGSLNMLSGGFNSGNSRRPSSGVESWIA